MTDLQMISNYTVWELLEYVMDNPTALTDSYYRIYGRAIEERYQVLLKEHNAGKC